MVKFTSFQQIAPYIFWHIILGGKNEKERERERERERDASLGFDLKEYLPTDDEKSNFFDLEENYDDTEKSVKFGQPLVLLCV
jgi:hypothetical protein